MDINAIQGQIRTSTLNNVKKVILMAAELKKTFLVFYFCDFIHFSFLYILLCKFIVVWATGRTPLGITYALLYVFCYVAYIELKIFSNSIVYLIINQYALICFTSIFIKINSNYEPEMVIAEMVLGRQYTNVT